MELKIEFKNINIKDIPIHYNKVIIKKNTEQFMNLYFKKIFIT